MRIQPTPVTIVAGFLGSGKTTLVNQLVSGAHGRRITVLVNDFGAVNIDADLIVKRSQRIMELSNGCVCCSIQGDLVEQLQDLFQNGPTMDHLLIEASGVSHPGRIASVFGYPQFRATARLEAIVTLVDAASVDTLPEASANLVRSQIEVADIAILTKCDLVSEAELHRLRRIWLLPDQPVLHVSHGNVDCDLLLGIDPEGSHKSANPSRQNLPSFKTGVWITDQPVSMTWFRDTMKIHGADVFRAKGFLNLSEFAGQKVLYQKVGSRESFEPVGEWPLASESRLAFIAETDMSELIATLERSKVS